MTKCTNKVKDTRSQEAICLDNLGESLIIIFFFFFFSLLSFLTRNRAANIGSSNRWLLGCFYARNIRRDRVRISVASNNRVEVDEIRRAEKIVVGCPMKTPTADVSVTKQLYAYLLSPRSFKVILISTIDRRIFTRTRTRKHRTSYEGGKRLNFVLDEEARVFASRARATSESQRKKTRCGKETKECLHASASSMIV